MKTREQILAENPLPRIMRDYGIEVPDRTQAMVKCCFHEDGQASLSVNTQTGVFHCHGCKASGSVIDFVSRKEGISIPDAMKRLANEIEPYRPIPNGHSQPAPAVSPPPLPGAPGKIVATYSYKDKHGEEMFQVVRLEPKTFRQRHQRDGAWVWNMEGVPRVLYNLPQIVRTNVPYIWVVEGEKDVDNLKKCGFVPTCNVGGAGKWLEGYNEIFQGKEAILCGDNDKPGREHMEKVLESICKIAKSVRVIHVPEPHKDASDYLATFNGDHEAAARAFFELVESAPVLNGGVIVPIQTFSELEREYQEHVKDAETTTLNLGRWLPSLGRNVRNIVPGELVMLLADTGVGKTACLQNLALHSAPVQTLLFELELPGTLTFERFVALSNTMATAQVYNTYRAGQSVDWKSPGRLSHVCVCSRSRLTPADLEIIINQAELKTGNRPRIVLVDYIGLMRGEGKSKYEKVSSIAEELKVIAKTTKTIIVVASQVHRHQAEGPEICLHDGKDSGSIENSSGLVIGLWRDEDDPTLLKAKVLKNTKGRAGIIINCNFDGPTMTITERSPIADSDIPRSQHND